MLGTGQVGIPRETSNIIVVRSLGDFSSLDDSQKAQLEQLVLQGIMKKFPDVIITVSTISEGEQSLVIPGNEPPHDKTNKVAGHINL